MGRKLLLLILLISFTAQAQDLEQNPLFSQSIEANINKYKYQSQKAYAEKDFERAEFLFDSLINYVVNGSTMDNFSVRKKSGRKIQLHDFEKPVFLMTYASWCTPGQGEIPALNDIVKKYHKDIDFVILFWDSKTEARKKAREYDRRINVVYVDELENTNCHVLRILKHSLGFPTTFFLDKNKDIIDVRRGVLHPYHEKYQISFELNYNSFYNGIALLKNLPSTNDETLVVKNPLP